MRAPAKSFQDLIVWQKAHAFVLQVYLVTRRFPKSEGSLEECRYYLILAHDLNYLDKRPLWELTEEVGRLLNGYRSAILTPNS